MYKSHYIITADDVARVARSLEKSKVMRIGSYTPNKLEIATQIEEYKYEQVEEFIYLQALLTNKSEEAKEVRHEPSIKVKTYLSRATKIRVYKTI